MHAPYSGSPLTHPGATIVATGKASFRRDMDDIYTSFAMLRTGWIPSKTPLPNTIHLAYEDGLLASGTLCIDSLSVTNPLKTIRFILTQWMGNVLRITIVQVSAQNDVTAETRDNPPDLNRQSEQPAQA